MFIPAEQKTVNPRVQLQQIHHTTCTCLNNTFISVVDTTPPTTTPACQLIWAMPLPALQNDKEKERKEGKLLKVMLADMVVFTFFPWCTVLQSRTSLYLSHTALLLNLDNKNLFSMRTPVSPSWGMQKAQPEFFFFCFSFIIQLRQGEYPLQWRQRAHRSLIFLERSPDYYYMASCVSADGSWRVLGNVGGGCIALIKNKQKISSNIRKLRWDRVQSHI